MPDGIDTYKSTLTAQEVDTALKNIGNVQQSVQQAANYAAAAEDAAERAEAAAGINPDDYPLKVQALARPNLLINSYFSGGGSQLGGDRLPINQRGSTTYTSGKCIDMGSLDLNNGGLSLSLKSDCIRLTQTSVAGGTNAQAMVMRFPASKITPGGTYTLSALVRGTGSARILLFADAVVQESSVYVQCTSAWQLVTATFSMPSTISTSSGRIYLYADTDGLLRYTEYLAVKLEEGDTQSLACQMPNGLWQLLPQSDFDYASQFAQCQRFFVRMKFQQSATIANVMRAGTWYSIDLPLQTPMYKIPTVTWTCSPRFVSDSVPVPAPAISMPGSYLNLGAALTTSPAKADYVFASTAGYIDISAELS